MFKFDTKEWNWPGIIFTLIGLAILIGVALVTACTSDAPAMRCDQTELAGKLPAGRLGFAPPEADRNGDGKADPQQISVNSKLCVVLDAPQILAADVAELKARQAVLDAAIAEEKRARAASDAKPADAALRTALSTATTARTNAQARIDAQAREKQMALFIDGRPSPGTIALRAPTGGGATVRQIELDAAADASSDEGKLWRKTLGAIGFHSSRVVDVALGDKDALSPRVPLGQAEFKVFTPWLVMLGGAGVLSLMTGILVLGWNTTMLRDRKPSENAHDPMPAFSLGRVQMAWWFALTISGYLYIWLISGQSLGVLTTGIATLLGISGASGALARVIDATIPAPESKSVNFFADLISDSGVIGIHRVQMVIWTLILGGVFGWTVITSFSFPLFDQAMLLLVGVVNGVYVGFKPPEKAAAVAAAATNSTP